MICCNDAFSGRFAGRFAAAHLLAENDFQPLLCLEGPDVATGLVDRRDSPLLRVGRILVPSLVRGTWVGGWCWDYHAIHVGSAVRVLAYLKGRGWSATCGSSALFVRWSDAEPIGAGDIHAAVGGHA